jgi:hypothetical protein
MKALAAAGHRGLLELTMATHADMTTTSSRRSPPSGSRRPAIRPRAGRTPTWSTSPCSSCWSTSGRNGFATFIVSGGGIEFMRPWTEEVYGIPPEQVVGSSIATAYELRDGLPVLVRKPEIDFIDDKEGKPVGINSHIGRRPIVAFGNSDGDFQMLEWTTAGDGARLGVSSTHDGDAVRASPTAQPRPRPVIEDGPYR